MEKTLSKIDSSLSKEGNSLWDGRFVKMEGLGNDFVIIDGRSSSCSQDDGVTLSDELRQQLADRRRGVGCDQLIVLEKGSQTEYIRMRIFNQDGSEAESCGNAARCVGALLRDEMSNHSLTIETAAGLLEVEEVTDSIMRVDLGKVRLNWRDIPLTKPKDVTHISLGEGVLSDGCAVNVGNPHIVFLVSEMVSSNDLRLWGAECSSHCLFPDGVNVSFVHLLGKNQLRVRVWERGVGVTLACGTAAAAALVVASLRLKTDRAAQIILDGGKLMVEWLQDDHVVIEGETKLVFRGALA